MYKIDKPMIRFFLLFFGYYLLFALIDHYCPEMFLITMCLLVWGNAVIIQSGRHKTFTMMGAEKRIAQIVTVDGKLKSIL